MNRFEQLKEMDIDQASKELIRYYQDNSGNTWYLALDGSASNSTHECRSRNKKWLENDIEGDIGYIRDTLCSLREALDKIEDKLCNGGRRMNNDKINEKLVDEVVANVKNLIGKVDETTDKETVQKATSLYDVRFKDSSPTLIARIFNDKGGFIYETSDVEYEFEFIRLKLHLIFEGLKGVSYVLGSIQVFVLFDGEEYILFSSDTQDKLSGDESYLDINLTSMVEIPYLIHKGIITVTPLSEKGQ